MTNLRRKFKNKFEKKQDVPYTISGLLGNGAGIVKVPSRSNYVYVRLAGSGVAEVFNNRVQNTFDLPVICGYDPVDPQRFQVLSIQGSTTDAVGGYISTGSGYAPASRYRWMYPGGGQDPLFSELRQFMPLRISPTTDLKINIQQQVIWNGTTWEIFGGAETDLTSLVPDTDGKCCMVLISIDEDGDIVTTAGNEVDIADLVITDIPEPPANTRYVLGAIRLYYGQTKIQEARTNTDVVDLRFPMFSNLSYSEIIGTLDWDSINFTGSDLADLATKSHTSLTDIGTQTHAELETAIGGKAPTIHDHVEADITDLDHDAVKIDGIAVDLTGVTDGQALIYDLATTTIIPGEAGSGDPFLELLVDDDMNILFDDDGDIIYEE